MSIRRIVSPVKQIFVSNTSKKGVKEYHKESQQDNPIAHLVLKINTVITMTFPIPNFMG